MTTDATDKTPFRGWRARIISGIMVKADDANGPVISVKGPIGRLLEEADIKYCERIHGQHSRQNDFVMLVDEDGKDRGLAYNSRAHYLSGYPIHAPIIGNALFFSEYMGDEGMDIQHLSDRGRGFLNDPLAGGVTLRFRDWVHMHMDYMTEYHIRYPQPV